MTSERSQLLKITDLVLAALTIISIAILLLYLWLSESGEMAVLSADPQWLLLAVILFVVNLLANMHSRLPAIKQQADMPWSLPLGGVSAVALMLIFSPGICGILWILLVAQLPRYFPWKTCLLAAIVVPLLIGIYYQFVFARPFALINSGLYILFNLFVIYLGFTLESEKQARETASRLVTELTATQQLLASTSKRDERLRIARELHDLSGHHLAALSLQLEVARHTDGEKHHHAVERAGLIAHLLLSELRQTVSEFREHRGIDVQQALTTLVLSLPRPRTWLVVPDNVCIDDVQVAETLLRCAQEALTNIVRHSRAERAALVLNQQDQILTLSIEDSGGCCRIPAFGNGLNGMQERLAQHQGTLSVMVGQYGLRLDIHLPLGNGLIV